MSYKCEKCCKQFKHKGSYNKHLLTYKHHKNKKNFVLARQNFVLVHQNFVEKRSLNENLKKYLLYN